MVTMAGIPTGEWRIFHGKILTSLSQILNVCRLLQLFSMKLVVVVLRKSVCNHERILFNFKLFKVREHILFLI
jgi:hypothetical protein